MGGCWAMNVKYVPRRNMLFVPSEALKEETSVLTTMTKVYPANNFYNSLRFFFTMSSHP